MRGRPKQTNVEKIKKYLSNAKDTFDYALQARRTKEELYFLEQELLAKQKELQQTVKRKAHTQTITGNLKELEKQIQTIALKKSKDPLVTILTSEIERLKHITKEQNEQLTKIDYDSSLNNVEEPTLIKHKNPFIFLKNYSTYKKQKKEFEKAVKKVKDAEFHFTLSKELNGVKVENNGTRHFKSDYIRVYDSYVEVGNRLIRTYYLADIPAYLSPYVFFKLITSSLPFTLSVFIEPTASGELIKKARQRLSVLEAQQADRQKKGKTRDQKTDKSIEEISSFIDELVHEVEKGMIYSLYLSIEAKDPQELKKLHKELKNLTDAMEMTFNTYSFGQQKGFQNFLPFNTDHVGENRVLQTTAGSYLMPFVSKQLHDPDGIFLGINAYHDSLVFVNPFTVRNSNVNIFGVSGAGKSVTAKALAMRLYTRGTQIIIIDPEAEYVDFARKLGGEVIQFSRDNGINPFYIPSTNEHDILDHISILKTFFKFFLPNDIYNAAVLDDVLIRLYDDGVPNFDNFLKLLKNDPMHTYLKVLDEGSLRGVFNSKRRLELNNDLIVFDISPLVNSEKKAPAMYLLTSLIWDLVNRKSDRKRMLFIDEAHKLLVDRDVAIFYREMVKQARKRNLGVVSITQDVEDFLNDDFGKAIITNSETKILLKQSYATLSLMDNIYPMTSDEKQQLGNLGIGEVVLFRENEHMRVDLFVLPHEQDLLFPQNR